MFLENKEKGREALQYKGQGVREYKEHYLLTYSVSLLGRNIKGTARDEWNMSFCGEEQRTNYC